MNTCITSVASHAPVSPLTQRPPARVPPPALRRLAGAPKAPRTAPHLPPTPDASRPTPAALWRGGLN